MARQYSQSGFSLIEVLVVVFVMGLLSAFALPSFLGVVENTKLERQYIEMAAALREAKPQTAQDILRQIMLFKGDRDGDLFLSNTELQEFPCSVLERTEGIFAAYRTEDGKSKLGFAAQALIWNEMISKPGGATFKEWVQTIGWSSDQYRGIVADNAVEHVVALPDGHLPSWSGIKSPTDPGWHPGQRLQACGPYPQA